jgi:small redox-active disulfide protein 2
MKIEVLGSGCMKCAELEKRVKEAVRKAGVKAEITHVYDFDEIVRRNVISTPALAIDGKVVLAGRLPNVEEIMELLR